MATTSRRTRSLATLLLLATTTACGDLEISNPNEPDRERALTSGVDIEALIAGTFRTWWGLQQGAQNLSTPAAETNLADALAAASDETANSGLGGPGEVADEPRVAAINDANYRWGGYLTSSWYLLSRALASIRDGLISVEGGVVVGTTPAEAARLQAFAKLMQGLATGHMAMIYDRAFILDETVKDPQAVKLQPYAETMAQAIKYLDRAAELAGAATFTIPAGWMGPGSFSSQDIVRIARSYQARFLVQVARNPTERAAVNWNLVLTHAQAGVTRDFGITQDGPGGRWSSSMKSGTETRMKLPYVGPADQSGGWQKWEAAGPADKNPFLIDTDDRRVTGGTPTTDGTLIKYWPTHTANPSRGIYFFSNYSSKHYLLTAGTNLGFVPDLTVQEMQYLIAEAYIRTNRADQALPIINKTRVEQGKLPPATATGVSGARCVPRTAKGACGNLLETLAWERQIMLGLLSQGSVFYDKRGFGTLLKDTWTQLPVPAKDLLVLKEKVYTFGGAGGQSSAPGR
jgi:hypothetical protein